MTTAKEALLAQLAAQTIGRHFGPQSPEAYDKPVNFVVASNGVFRVVKTPIALFKQKVSEIDEKAGIPGLTPMEEGPELLIPKIPVKHLIDILSFYRDVHDKDKTEASNLFFWNHDELELPREYDDKTPITGLHEDGQLVTYCPKQENSGTLTEFHQDDMVNYLRQHTTPLCEVHSHHTMNAFWSGTDDANENATQFYGVWGNINKENPHFLFRWVCGSQKINVDPSILFDIPQIETKTTVTRTLPIQGIEPEVTETVTYETFQGPWPKSEYPSDWMGQHSVKKYTYAKTTYTPPGKSTAAGATTHGTRTYGPPDGFESWQAYYDWIDGYAPAAPGKQQAGTTTQTQAGTGHESFKDKLKKNERKANGGTGGTVVDVYVDDEYTDPRAVDLLEDKVFKIAQTLIDYGFDRVMADAIFDEPFAEANEDEQLN